MKRMKRVVDVMSKRPVLVHLSATAGAARWLAEQSSVHHLLVIDEGGAIVGVACLCDLADQSASAPLGASVRSPFAFVTPRTWAADAARTMLDCCVGCLPVLDEEGTIAGVVTRRDLRGIGVLPNVRGIDRCAGCGDTHGLGRVPHGGDIVFCRECIDRARPPRDGARVTTLGGSE
jgi:CBS domain-containing protein